MDYIFEPQKQASVAIKDSQARLPVHRIYCVGRNYAEHAREMGGDPDRQPPFFFCKPADAVVENNTTIAFPSETDNLHHEVELVIALKAGGKNIPADKASEMIFGYGVGIDLTRRDIQKVAKEMGRPWDAAKAFDHSAPVTHIVPVEETALTAESKITLSVNGELRQEGAIGDMVWSIEETIAALSKLFELKSGDLIFTGTPAGVAALKPGDEVEASVEGVGELTIKIGD